MGLIISIIAFFICHFNCICCQSVYLRSETLNDFFCDSDAERIGKTMTVLRCANQCNMDIRCSGFFFDAQHQCYKTVNILSKSESCEERLGTKYFAKPLVEQTTTVTPTTTTTTLKILTPTTASFPPTTKTTIVAPTTTTTSEAPTTTMTSVEPSITTTSVAPVTTTTTTTSQLSSKFFSSCIIDIDCQDPVLLCLSQYYDTGVEGPRVCYCKFPLRFSFTLGYCVDGCNVYTSEVETISFNRWIGKSLNEMNGMLLRDRTYQQCVTEVSIWRSGFNFGHSTATCFEKNEVESTVISDSSTMDYYARNCE